jgi:hypothetical protein
MISVPNQISYPHANFWIFSQSRAILINFLKSKIDLDFPIFNSKSISNLKKILWRKLFLSSKPSQPYFVSNCLSSGRSFLEWSKFERN